MGTSGSEYVRSAINDALARVIPDDADRLAIEAALDEMAALIRDEQHLARRGMNYGRDLLSKIQDPTND